MSDLDDALAAARAALDAAPDGHLQRPARIAVLAAMAPYPRAGLTAWAARQLIPAWNADQPEDGRPELLLSAVISSQETLDLARERVDELWRDVEQAEPALDEQPFMAAMAVRAAVYSAVDDGSELEHYPDLDDQDYDPELWSAEYIAEIMQFSDDYAINVEPRRDYWRQWLDEAAHLAATAGERPS